MGYIRYIIVSQTKREKNDGIRFTDLVSDLISITNYGDKTCLFIDRKIYFDREERDLLLRHLRTTYVVTDRDSKCVYDLRGKGG